MTTIELDGDVSSELSDGQDLINYDDDDQSVAETFDASDTFDTFDTFEQQPVPSDSATTGSVRVGLESAQSFAKTLDSNQAPRTRQVQSRTFIPPLDNRAQTPLATSESQGGPVTLPVKQPAFKFPSAPVLAPVPVPTTAQDPSPLPVSSETGNDFVDMVNAFSRVCEKAQFPFNPNGMRSGDLEVVPVEGTTAVSPPVVPTSPRKTVVTPAPFMFPTTSSVVTPVAKNVTRQLPLEPHRPFKFPGNVAAPTSSIPTVTTSVRAPVLGGRLSDGDTSTAGAPSISITTTTADTDDGGRVATTAALPDMLRAWGEKSVCELDAYTKMASENTEPMRVLLPDDGVACTNSMRNARHTWNMVHTALDKSRIAMQYVPLIVLDVYNSTGNSNTRATFDPGHIRDMSQRQTDARVAAEDAYVAVRSYIEANVSASNAARNRRRKRVYIVKWILALFAMATIVTSVKLVGMHSYVTDLLTTCAREHEGTVQLNSPMRLCTWSAIIPPPFVCSSSVTLPVMDTTTYTIRVDVSLIRNPRVESRPMPRRVLQSSALPLKDGGGGNDRGGNRGGSDECSVDPDTMQPVGATTV